MNLNNTYGKEQSSFHMTPTSWFHDSCAPRPCSGTQSGAGRRLQACSPEVGSHHRSTASTQLTGCQISQTVLTSSITPILWLSGSAEIFHYESCAATPCFHHHGHGDAVVTLPPPKPQRAREWGTTAPYASLGGEDSPLIPSMLATAIALVINETRMKKSPP